MSITLFFKEGKDRRLYFQYLTSINFIEYENEKKTISMLKSVNFICELDGKFHLDPCKVFYKKQDDNVLKKTICVNCNDETSQKRLNTIPFYFLTKFVKYMRCLNTFDQLKIETKDILNAVNPITVLEHKEEGIDSRGNKQHYTDLKIGLIRSDKSDLPIPIKRNYPKLQNKDSNRLNENLMIKNGSVEVCENCYFMLNNVYNMTNSDLNAKILQNEYKKNIKNENKGYLSERKEINIEENGSISTTNENLNIKDSLKSGILKSSSQKKFLSTNKASSLVGGDLNLDKFKSEKSIFKLYSPNSILHGSTAHSTPYFVHSSSNFDNFKKKILHLDMKVERSPRDFIRPFTTRNNMKKDIISIANHNYSNFTNSLVMKSSFNSSKIYSVATTIKTPKNKPDNKPAFSGSKVNTMRTSLKKGLKK